MSATKELREMLDECGIEYEQSCTEGIAEYTHVTKWKMQTGNKCTFYEIEDGYPPYFTRMFIETPTAAQAIAATVQDEASTHKALIRESDARMALQRDYNNQIKRIQNQRKQLREMQAALERGTCHVEVRDNMSETDGMGDVWLECDECHWQMPLEPTTPRFKYCPNCGRKVFE